MDQYGPKESLFRQLDARKMGETQTADGVVMHLCRTPPTLHRTFQSRRVVETIPEEDKDRIINKRQQTVLGSIMTHFSHDESGELKHNERLAVKAMHMREQLDRFFIEQLEQDPVGGYDRIKALANEHKITAISDKLSAYNHEERFVNPYP